MPIVRDVATVAYINDRIKVIGFTSVVTASTTVAKHAYKTVSSLLNALALFQSVYGVLESSKEYTMMNKDANV